MFTTKAKMMGIVKRGHRHTKIVSVMLMCLSGLWLGSCSSSSTGSEGGNNGGGNNGGSTPSEPTFSNVQTIFNGNCATSGCHNSSTQQNGVDLSSYDAAMNSVGSQYGTEVIKPNDADGSPLVDKISSDNPQYGVRMPKDRAPLSSDQINLIRQWINEGAQNN